MKKFQSLWKNLVLFGCLSVPGILAAQSAAANRSDFHAVAATLDQGGIAYSYTNVSEAVTPLIRGAKIVLSLVDQDGSISDKKTFTRLEDGVKAFWNESGLAGIRGCGSSLIRGPNGLFVLKHTLYAPAALQKGIFWDLYGRPAHSLAAEWNQIPATAIFACHSDLNTSGLYDFVTGFLRTQVPEAVPAMDEILANAKKQGINVPRLLEQIKGVTLYIDNDPAAKPVVPGLTGFALLLAMPTAELFDIVAKQMPPESIRDGVLTIPNTMPVSLFLEKGFFVITNDVDGVKTRLAGSGKTITPPAPKMIGNAFVYWSPGLAKTLNAVAAASVPQKYHNSLVQTISLFGLDRMLLAVSARSPVGYQTTVTSQSEDLMKLLSLSTNISMLPGGAAIPVLSGLLLPALNQVKETGKQASCMTNLKQVAIALMLYANDCTVFPPEDHVAGLQKLIDGNYLNNRSVLSCPSKPMTGKKPTDPVSYLYFGGFQPDKLTQPSCTPLLMDKPGNHTRGKTGFCCAFADGHVEKFAGHFTSAEAQLNAIPGIPDEVKPVLLEKVRAWDKANGR